MSCIFITLHGDVYTTQAVIAGWVRVWWHLCKNSERYILHALPGFKHCRPKRATFMLLGESATCFVVQVGQVMRQGQKRPRVIHCVRTNRNVYSWE